MKTSILKTAQNFALEYLPKHPQKNHLHYSWVVQDNSIVEWGVNTNGEPPIHYGYHDRINGLPKRHAEYNAFLKARGILDLRKPWEMINIRLTRSGELRMSKPCSCCYNFLSAFSCKRFWFSTDSGFESVLGL